MREKFRQWLAETHGAGFELVRHFFLRFFDSDLITTPGQLEALMVGVFSSLAAFGLLLPSRLYRKYFDLSTLDTGDLYHQAVLADKLFFIAFSMAVIGIIVAIEWHSLFPSVRDSLVLTPLPVTLRQVFGAKFLALILFVSLFIFAVNFLNSLMFPAMVASKWQAPPVGMRYVLAYGLASSAAAYFVFFSVVGCAGILMNVLSARLFQKISLYLQTLVLLLLLCILPLLFYIPNFDQLLASRPGWASKLPPLWFLGLSQVLQGNPDPYFDALAGRAVSALAAAFGATLVLYFISYRRQAGRLPGSSGERMTQSGVLISTVLNKLLPDVQQRAAFSFIGKTLNRSRHHKLLLAGYVGIGLALVVDGFVTLLLERQIHRIDWLQTRWLQAVLSAPMVFSFFLLSGMRYVFSIPVELRANWIFRVTETDARDSHAARPCVAAGRRRGRNAFRRGRIAVADPDGTGSFRFRKGTLHLFLPAGQAQRDADPGAVLGGVFRLCLHHDQHRSVEHGRSGARAHGGGSAACGLLPAAARAQRILGPSAAII
ncbi:MAG: hypothetical protein HYX25_07960 [Candidatus Solibacter usitatus]|nr:hypothetical protein [Candidatus Solibacter usitatus]